jgi:hypothetical protein
LPAQLATEMIFPPAGSLNRGTRICLFNHSWCMLCGDTHQGLRQRRICFGLGVCIFVLLLWLGEFCCITSEACRLDPRWYLLDAMCIARRTLCQFDSTAATARERTRQYDVRICTADSSAHFEFNMALTNLLYHWKESQACLPASASGLPALRSVLASP